jgi:tetratricopeptide (TPR) repeat protein
MAQAYVLTSAGRYEEALAALDAIPLRGLSSDQTALWLNNRAYALALMGRSDEALDHLDDAGAIFADGGLEDTQLQSCLHGTRGIALLRSGALDEAEQELRAALELGETLPSPADPSDLASADRERLTAERYYWLAEVAVARQQRDEAQACLRLAAELPGTPFGRRALERLAALG